MDDEGVAVLATYHLAVFCSFLLYVFKKGLLTFQSLLMTCHSLFTLIRSAEAQSTQTRIMTDCMSAHFRLQSIIQLCFTFAIINAGGFGKKKKKKGMFFFFFTLSLSSLCIVFTHNCNIDQEIGAFRKLIKRFVEARMES